MPLVLAMALTACGSSSDVAQSVQTPEPGGGSSQTTNGNTVLSSVTPGSPVTGTVGESKVVTMRFATDDSGEATDLRIVSGLDPIEAGWHGPSAAACPRVSSAVDCTLTLTFAPTGASSGTLVLGFNYVDKGGTAKTGSANIEYTSLQPAQVYIPNSKASSIQRCRFDVTDGSLVACAIAATGIDSPTQVAFQGSHAYVISNSDSQLRHCAVDPDGNLTDCATTGSGLSQPVGMAFGNGHLLVTSLGNNAIVKCTIDLPSGLLSACDPLVNEFSYPEGIALKGDKAYVTSVSTGAILTCDYDDVTVDINNCASTATGFNVPIDILLRDTDAYVSDYGTGVVNRCLISSPDRTIGSCSEVASGIPNAAGLLLRNGLLYVTALGDDSIRICIVNDDGSLNDCRINDGGFSGPALLTVRPGQ